MVITKKDSAKRRERVSTKSRTNTLIYSLSKESSQQSPSSKFITRSFCKRSQTCDENDSLFASKYKHVWRRARCRLRSVFILKKIRRDMTLFGVNTLNLNFSNLPEENCSKEFYQRASRLFSNTEDFRKFEKVPFLIILPSSMFYTIWIWVVVLILLYSAIATPFTVAFLEPEDYPELENFDLFISILFFLDFCVNLLTAYYDKDRNLITDRYQIFKNYAKGWMIIDILTWFPFELVTSSDSGKNRKFARILRIPKLYRLLRFSKLLKLMKTHVQKDIFDKIQEFLSIKNSAVKIVKSYLTIILFVHIVACFWYLTSKLDDFNPDTWVVRMNYEDSDTGSLYLTSLYWAFTTLSTVGYGDICPSTRLERVLSFFWMSFGLYFFSFNISSLTALVSSIDLKENALANKLAMIEEFSSEANLPKSTRAKLKACFKYSAEKRGFSWLEKMNILNELPKILRFEVARAMHHGAAKHLKFFRNKKETFITVIIPMLEPMYVEDDLIIYKANDAADEIFFITKGLATLEFGRNLIVKTLRKDSHFGDIEICTRSRRKFQVFTNSFCEILVMSKRVIYQIQQEYPYMWRHIHVKAVQREKKYMRTVVHFQEMEKFNRGDIEFEDYEKQFSGHVERVLNEKLSIIRKETQEVSLEELVKKMNDLIEIAESRKTVKLGFC
jgi:hyperpolarization activated cyclic nucleotide-gated potassium channel 1